jgi:hypothetical protein
VAEEERVAAEEASAAEEALGEAVDAAASLPS